MIDTVVETCACIVICGVWFGLVQCCICDKMDVKKNFFKKLINRLS